MKTQPERDIEEVLRRELGKEARAFQKLKGGRNSQVFRVDCEDGTVFAAKAYFQSEKDRRDRIGNEFRALEFLKGEGFGQVPAPLAADAGLRVGIYEYVDGDQVPKPVSSGAKGGFVLAIGGRVSVRVGGVFLD
jgi:predicted Ser/Thr protein kinase